MPRKRPGALRAAPATAYPRRRRDIPGLPSAVNSAIRRVIDDSAVLGPEVYDAYETWARLAARSGPTWRHLDVFCPCCHQGGHPRDVLDRLARRLPGSAARTFGRRLAGMDERIVRRVIPDPFAPPGPWWRRCHEFS